MKTEIDNNIEIPSDLESCIESLLDGMDASTRILTEKQLGLRGPQAERRARIARIKRSIYSISAAASIVLAGWLGYGLVQNSAPQDTFDDPQLAYAEVERVLASISGNLRPSVEGMDKAESIIGKQQEIYNGIRHSHNRNK